MHELQHNIEMQRAQDRGVIVSPYPLVATSLCKHLTYSPPHRLVVHLQMSVISIAQKLRRERKTYTKKVCCRYQDRKVIHKIIQDPYRLCRYFALSARRFEHTLHARTIFDQKVAALSDDVIVS